MKLRDIISSKVFIGNDTVKFSDPNRPVENTVLKRTQRDLYWCNSGEIFTSYSRYDYYNGGKYTGFSYKTANIYRNIFLGDSVLYNSKYKPLYLKPRSNSFSDSNNLKFNIFRRINAYLQFDEDGKFNICSFGCNMSSGDLVDKGEEVLIDGDYFDSIIYRISEFHNILYRGEYYILGDKVCLLNNDTSSNELKGVYPEGYFIVPSGCVSFGALDKFNCRGIKLIVFPDTIKSVVNFMFSRLAKGSKVCFSSKTSKKIISNILGFSREDSNYLSELGDDLFTLRVNKALSNCFIEFY